MAVTKEKPIDKEVALEMAEDFLERFEFCCNQPKAPTASDLDKSLAKNFQIVCNGRTLAKSLDEYVSLLGDFQKKYAHVEVTALNTDMLSSGYQIVAQYTLHLTAKDGAKSQVNFMAIATIEDHHFCKWNEVACQQGRDDWLPRHQ